MKIPISYMQLSIFYSPPSLRGWHAPLGYEFKQIEIPVINEINLDLNTKTSFENLIASGYIGYCITKDNDLCAYGWVTTPESGPPIHIPRELQNFPYWIFNCHTLKIYRGTGLFKYLLEFILFKYSLEGFNRTIFIDCLVKNSYSDKGIRRSGFRRVGEIDVLNISLRRPFLFNSSILLRSRL